MYNSSDVVSKTLKVDSETKIIDIGGGVQRFSNSKNATVIDLVEPGDDEFRGKFIKLDICSELLPFKDNEFDVCICSHTIEDIYNPYHILNEMQRVAKRGYIETPHKDMEINFDISKTLGEYPGWGHHKWILDNINDKLVLTWKGWYLLTYDAIRFNDSKYRRSCKKFFEYYWEENFEFEIVDVVTQNRWESMIADHNTYVGKLR